MEIPRNAPNEVLRRLVMRDTWSNSIPHPRTTRHGWVFSLEWFVEWVCSGGTYQEMVSLLGGVALVRGIGVGGAASDI